MLFHSRVGRGRCVHAVSLDLGKTCSISCIGQKGGGLVFDYFCSRIQILFMGL